MISEKGLCKILKAAYKTGGYNVIPKTILAENEDRWRRDELILNGAAWAVRCQTEELPKAAAVQITKNVGYLPVKAVCVQKGAPNQIILEETAASRSELLGTQDQARLDYIAALDWEKQQEHDDPVVNLSLLDGGKDVAPVDREEG